MDSETNLNTTNVSTNVSTNVLPLINTERVLIAFTGEIASGKSTATRFLINKYNLLEYSFATPLKNIAIILGFNYHQVYGTQEEKLEINQFWKISGRHFMQKFGTEVCRDLLPHILPEMKLDTSLWIKLFEKFYYENKRNNILVSDLRFSNEADAINKLNGFIIKIVRIKSSDIDNEGYNLHPSELQITTIKPHVIIINDGTIDVFKRKVLFIGELIKKNLLLKNSDVPYTL